MDRIEPGTRYAVAVDQLFPEPVRSDIQARVDLVMQPGAFEVDNRLIQVMKDSGRKQVFVVQRFGAVTSDMSASDSYY